jgi:hypothetical protein
VVGPALPLSSTSTFSTPSKHPRANISTGKLEEQIIFLGVNIYPYHPNSAHINYTPERKEKKG